MKLYYSGIHANTDLLGAALASAYCATCHWEGPDQDTPAEAEADLIEHRRTHGCDAP